VLKFVKNNPIMYPAEIVNPMKAEMTAVGFQELTTPQQVDDMMQTGGTTLVFFNSVCGCAAGSARPGVKMAVQNSAKKPSNLTTVFAGFDVDAVKQARTYTLPYPPSSPCIALFKDGQIVHFIERHHIEGRSAEMVAQNLMGAFEEHC
jgi:putative YphP/YqiW family bacilliredoxin